MQKFSIMGLANTFAIIDLVLHPLFHIWISVAPLSYERAMNLFVAGLHLKITEFDSSFSHIVFGTIFEAVAFWLLGASAAFIYNHITKKL